MGKRKQEESLRRLRELLGAVHDALQLAEQRAALRRRAWLTTDEAALYVRMTPNALRKHVAAGSLKPDSWGKRGRTQTHRFRRSTLDAFLAGDEK